MRLDRAKKPTIDDDVPDVVVGEPGGAQRLGVGRSDLLGRAGQALGVVEQDAAPFVEGSLAPVDGDEVGDLGILVADAQDRPVSDDAVRAAVGRRRGDDDQLTIGLGQCRRVLVHDQVVEPEERPEQRRSRRQGAEHVGNEAGLGGDLGGPGVDVGDVAADRRRSLRSPATPPQARER